MSHPSRASVVWFQSRLLFRVFFRVIRVFRGSKAVCLEAVCIPHPSASPRLRVRLLLPLSVVSPRSGQAGHAPFYLCSALDLSLFPSPTFSPLSSRAEVSVSGSGWYRGVDARPRRLGGRGSRRMGSSSPTGRSGPRLVIGLQKTGRLEMWQAK